MEYVCTGATLKCTMGTSCPKLKATPKHVSLTGKDQANIADYVSMKNVPSFGRCRSLGYPPTASATAANHGKLTPMPCVPGTCPKWKAIDKDSLICGEPALLKPATLKCMYGGTISIVDPGQTLEIKKGNVIKGIEREYSLPEQKDNNKNTKINKTTNSEIVTQSLSKKKNVSAVDDIPDECLADFNVPEDNILANLSPIPFHSYILEIDKFNTWNERFSKDVDELNSLHNTTFKLLLAKNNDGTYKLNRNQILAFEKRIKAAESLKDSFCSNGSTMIEDWRKDLQKAFAIESLTMGAAKLLKYIPNIKVFYSNNKGSGAMGYFIKGGKKNRDKWEKRIEGSFEKGSSVQGIEEDLINGTMNQKLGIWAPKTKAQTMKAYLKIQEDIELAQNGI